MKASGTIVNGGDGSTSADINPSFYNHTFRPSDWSYSRGPTGWRCPGCGRCYSPTVGQCSFCGQLGYPWSEWQPPASPWGQQTMPKWKPGESPTRAEWVIPVNSNTGTRLEYVN